MRSSHLQRLRRERRAGHDREPPSTCPAGSSSPAWRYATLASDKPAALKSLATHKTDRNDARRLAYLARTDFFKPMHVKSLSVSPHGQLTDHRTKKLVGQRGTLENQIRGLAVVFGSGSLVRSPPPSSTRPSEQARGRGSLRRDAVIAA
jgi:hypothetical protein